MEAEGSICTTNAQVRGTWALVCSTYLLKREFHTRKHAQPADNSFHFCFCFTASAPKADHSAFNFNQDGGLSLFVDVQ